MHDRKMEINITSKSDKNADLKFWLKKTPQERIDAVEFLRSQHYALSGYEKLPRLVPILRIRTVKD